MAANEAIDFMVRHDPLRTGRLRHGLRNQSELKHRGIRDPGAMSGL